MVGTMGHRAVQGWDHRGLCGAGVWHLYTCAHDTVAPKHTHTLYWCQACGLVRCDGVTTEAPQTELNLSAKHTWRRGRKQPLSAAQLQPRWCAAKEWLPTRHAGELGFQESKRPRHTVTKQFLKARPTLPQDHVADALQSEAATGCEFVRFP